MPLSPASGDLNSYPQPPVDLDLWPQDWCAMSPVARSTFRPILTFLRLFVIVLWANTHQSHGAITLTLTF